MKLLSPQQIRDAKSKDVALSILRTQEVEEALKKVNQRMAESQADFQSMLARNRSKWATEEEEHSNRIKEMEEDVKKLEDRKAQALIPISMYKQQADTLLEEAQTAFDHAVEKEKKAEETQELLEDRLDEVGEREVFAKAEEERIAMMRNGAEMQVSDVRAQTEQLTSQIADFKAKQEKEQADMDQRKRDLQVFEISLNEKIEKIKRDTDALAVYKRQLDDQRATLERALKRGG